ncbi:MAG: hypothetical protein JNK37_17725 [Verrucomicrobiales bacterium]|nr:hypothetical protein [Verrucomicrobiales bacterium]
MMKARPIILLPLVLSASLGWSRLATAQTPIQTGPSAPAPSPAPGAPLFGPVGGGSPVPAPPAPAPVAPTAAAPKAAPAAPATVDIDDIAKIPYEALLKIAQSDASQPKDAEIYTLRISSKIGVPVTQIELFLDRPAAPEKLSIDPNGYFLVPHNPTLVQENPDLVSNQPKGSLNLEVKLSLPKPELPKIVEGKVKYQDLFKPVQLLNESMRQVDPLFGMPGQQQFAIEFTTGAQGGLKLQRQFGSRTLQPDEKGCVWILFDKVLFDENPDVLVAPPQSPVSVRPVSAEQAAAIRAK